MSEHAVLMDGSVNIATDTCNSVALVKMDNRKTMSSLYLFKLQQERCLRPDIKEITHFSPTMKVYWAIFDSLVINNEVRN